MREENNRLIFLFFFMCLALTAGMLSGCLGEDDPDGDDGYGDGYGPGDDEDDTDGEDTTDGDSPSDGDRSDGDSYTDGDWSDGDESDGDLTDGDESEVGTWFDTLYGNTWQNPPMFGQTTYQGALDYCANLPGGSWRLPTIDELRSLIRGCDATQKGGECGVTNECSALYNCKDDSCDGCEAFGGEGLDGYYMHPDLQGAGQPYWSSTPVSDFESCYWGVSFPRAVIVYFSSMVDTSGVRCVWMGVEE